MRTHPLLALTITIAGATTLFPTAIAAAGPNSPRTPTGRHRPVPGPSQPAAVGAARDGGSVVALARPLSMSLGLTGPPQLLVQLPRIPRRYLGVLHPAATPPAAGGVWLALRRCESGGNYGENTGNGYYGAYQFALSTWSAIGYVGLPSEASPPVQDRAAAQLHNLVGWSAWPQCASALGL